MLHRGTDLLTQATAARTVVPAFATYTRELMQAVLAAAEQTGRPVIMLAGSSHFHHANQATLISIALRAAHASTATIGVHLDHRRDLTEILHCVLAGYSLVMVDGSHLPFEDNIALAVAVGNVPGRTSRPVSLGLDRSRQSAPRCRHRSSYMAPAVYPTSSSAAPSTAASPRSNINTELRQAHLAAVQSALRVVLPILDSVALWRAGRRHAVRSIHALSTTGRATLSQPDSTAPDPRSANRAAHQLHRHSAGALATF